MKKRILSAALATAMAVMALPTLAFPVNAGVVGSGVRKITLGTGGIAAPANLDGSTTYNYIYFGKYGGNDISWRVLSTTGNATGTTDSLSDGTNAVANAKAMFLLSENAFESIQFDEESPWSNTYQGSYAQSWCTTFYNGYNFTDVEKGAILETTKSDSETSVNDISYGTSSLNADKAFFLSVDEASNTAYFDNNDRRMASDGSNYVDWWLRSPYASDTNSVGIVDWGGDVYHKLVDLNVSARPAFNLNQNSVLFSSAASGGKSSGTVGEDALKSTASDTQITAWKLTLKDSGHTLATATTTEAMTAGNTISVDYAGATTGKMLSGVVVDSSGNVLYYGTFLSNTEVSGTVSITLPSDFDSSKMTLKLFTETAYKSNATDYASDFVDVAPVAPTFNVDGGTYNTAQSVKITSDNVGTTIYYTTDGSEPTTASTQYISDESITVSSAQTIKAIAVRGGISSTVSTVTYRIRTSVTGSFRLGTNGIYGDGTNFIYYGNFNSSDIKWRVLDELTNMGTNGLFLLSENALASIKFEDNCTDNNGNCYRNNTKIFANTYQGSSAQGWCTTFYDGNNFTDGEKGAILEITKSDSETSANGFSYGTSSLSTDKVFFLSAEEAEKYLVVTTRIAKYNSSAVVWWLRSPYASNTGGAGIVNDIGTVCASNVGTLGAARPAFNLNQTSVLFSSAAGASVGKATTGAESGLVKVSATTPTEWKLTLKDSTRTAFSVTETSITAAAGTEKTITYSGANTGTNEYVSAIICDDTGMLYYGRLANDSASGTASITIPSDLALGDYTIKVFNEQYNGDKQTDYSSAFKSISLSVVEPPVAPTFDVASGTYAEEQNVTISYADTAATIYYTTDGSEPTTASKLYDGAIPVSYTQTIKAIAVKDSVSSAVSMATYRFRPGVMGSFRLGTNGIYGGVTNFIYYGNFDTTDDSADNPTPIKWRVLDEQTNIGTNGLFLLSENVLDKTTFSVSEPAQPEAPIEPEQPGVPGEPEQPEEPESSNANAYQGSDAQTWCKDFAGGDDTLINVTDAFSTNELSAILETTKSDSEFTANGNNYGTSSLSADKVFFLSAEEAITYLDGATRKATLNGSYAYWWLRSPRSSTTNFAGVVSPGGYVDTDYAEWLYAARPAFNLKQTSVLFSSAAGASVGKATTGTESGLVKVSTTTPTEWKLTLNDSTRTAFSVTETSITAGSGTVQAVTYSGAKTGTNEYISAIICDDTGMLYYGRLANNSASGKASITIPSALAVGEYTIKVFNEQFNGDYATDYSSEFKNITLNVVEPTATVADVTVSGTQGKAITATDITLTVTNDTFKSAIAEDTVVST